MSKIITQPANNINTFYLKEWPPESGVYQSQESTPIPGEGFQVEDDVFLGSTSLSVIREYLELVATSDDDTVILYDDHECEGIKITKAYYKTLKNAWSNFRYFGVIPQINYDSIQELSEYISMSPIAMAFVTRAEMERFCYMHGVVPMIMRGAVSRLTARSAGMVYLGKVANGRVPDTFFRIRLNIAMSYGRNRESDLFEDLPDEIQAAEVTLKDDQLFHVVAKDKFGDNQWEVKVPLSQVFDHFELFEKVAEMKERWVSLLPVVEKPKVEEVKCNDATELPTASEPVKRAPRKQAVQKPSVTITVGKKPRKPRTKKDPEAS